MRRLFSFGFSQFRVVFGALIQIILRCSNNVWPVCMLQMSIRFEIGRSFAKVFQTVAALTTVCVTPSHRIGTVVMCVFLFLTVFFYNI